MRLSGVVVTIAVGVVMLISGCAHTVTGTAMRNSSDTGPGLRPSDADVVILGPAVVSDAVGVNVQTEADLSRPVVASSAVCSALDSVGMTAFVGRNWSGIRVLLFTDGDRHDQVVAEAVAIYADAAAASDAFRAGTKDTKACDGQRALITGSDESWAFSVPERTDDTVRWTKRQLAIPLTWLCHAEARLRNNAVLQAMACQSDGGGATVVTRLADRMSASVWELSGH